MTLTPESSPERLVTLYRRDAGVHPYALADLDLYWDVSTWWVDGDAAVGLMRLPSTTTPIAYAVSSADPTGTLRLIRHLIDGGHLPDRFVITGPDGLRDAIEATGYTSDWHYNYAKFALTDRGHVPPPEPTARRLDRSDLEPLQALLDECMGPSSFFTPELLDDGVYFGAIRDGRIVASAGTHIVSTNAGAAAIGNVATHPSARREGLARGTVAALIHTLGDQIPTIGLNVQRGNAGARTLYQSMGFTQVITYEEGEFVRRTA